MKDAVRWPNTSSGQANYWAGLWSGTDQIKLAAASQALRMKRISAPRLAYQLVSRIVVARAVDTVSQDVVGTEGGIFVIAKQKVERRFRKQPFSWGVSARQRNFLMGESTSPISRTSLDLSTVLLDPQ